MSGSRNKPALNVPRNLDSVRARRGSSSSADGRAVGLGLEIDAQGRPAQRLGRAQAFDDRGAAYVRVGGYLGYLPGSPERLVFLPGKERELASVAIPTILEVEAAPARITEVDNRVSAAIVNHEGRIQTVEAFKVMRECGVVTLTGTTPVQVDSGFVRDDPSVCFISLTPYAQGTLPGVRRVEEGTIVNNSNFYVVSDSATDDGSVFWAVFA